MYITTYQPLPISFVRGQGIWLYDTQGDAYLDSFSGIGVCNLGHAHPDVTRAIQTQAERLLHTSNIFHITQQETLAARLTEATEMKQAFFSNSGAEANETALKLIRLYGHAKGIEAPATIVMNGAFHGRTLATLSASGGRKAQAGYEPLVSGFIRAPFNDIEALRAIAQNRSDVAAVMLEPIQGEGGVQVASESYLHEVQALCQQQGWLYVLDEVQTGNARTGSLYAAMGFGLKPDIITTAKGLANGVPIGACLMRDQACDLFKPGMHGSTFGGNPLACAAALSVLDVIQRDDLCHHAETMGLLLKDMLLNELEDHPHVQQIRGKGLMIGLEMDQPCADIRLAGLQHGLLLNVTSEKVIRLLPPLIINASEIQTLVSRLLTTIKTYYNT